MNEQNKSFYTHSAIVEEALISSHDIDDDKDPIPINAKTARSVSFAKNYIVCNIVIQCLLFASLLFFVLTEDWYALKVDIVCKT